MADRTPEDRSLFQQVHELVTASLLGQASPDDMAQLEALVRDNNKARDIYLAYIAETSVLQAWAKQDPNPLFDEFDPKVMLELLNEVEAAAHRDVVRKAAEQTRKEMFDSTKLSQFAAVPPPDKNPPVRSIIVPWSVVYAIGGTIAAVILLIIGRFGQQRDVAPPAPIATVIDSAGAEWSDPALSVSRGSQLAAGKRVLTRGFIRIQFERGAELLVEAPTHLELTSDNSARLMQGKLVGQVPPRAIGFTLETPETVIVDLGTEFGVNVKTEGVSEVHVLKGLVEVGSNAGSDAPLSQRLAKGSAVKINDKGTITKIPFNQTAFRRRMPRLVPASVTVSATSDARLVDGNGDGSGDRADPLDQPSVPSERSSDGPQQIIGVGERNHIEAADQDERRYWIAFSLTQQDFDDVMNARFIQLAVTLASKRNVEGLRIGLYGVLDPASPSAGLDAYQAPATRLTNRAFDEYSLTKKPVLLDVTDFAKAQVKEGHRTLVFRLQVEGQQLPNKDKTFNCFLFRTRQTEDKSTAPMLQIRTHRFQ